MELPLSIKENGGAGVLVGIISANSDWFVAEEILHEDAEYIVKACNLLPELVEALEEFIDLGEHIISVAAFESTYKELQLSIDAAKELLTKAKQ